MDNEQRRHKDCQVETIGDDKYYCVTHGEDVVYESEEESDV